MSKPKGKRWKRIGKLALVLAVAGGVFLLGTNRAVLSSAEGRVYTTVSSIPSEPVALVLGTAPVVKGGNKNLYFERRMNTAAELYKAGKVKKVLVSGDNGRRGYDEPTAMKEALMKRGVPEDAIALDYAGFRTLDSVVRAHKVFGVTQCAIVTDDFHLPRALYIAAQEGIEAVGMQTEPLPRSISPVTHVREVASRALVWVDLHILNRQPKFLGPKESL